MAMSIEERRESNRRAQRKFYRKNKKKILEKYRKYRQEYYRYYWNLHKGAKNETTESNGSTVATFTKEANN